MLSKYRHEEGQGQTFCKDISTKKLHWNMATKGLSVDTCCLKLSFKSILEVGKVQHINIKLLLTSLKIKQMKSGKMCHKSLGGAP